MPKTKSIRGRFRTMTMQSLDDSRLSHLWDDEVSRNGYGFPLSSDAQTDEKLWIDIDSQALKSVGPFTTTDSPDTHKGPFLNAIDFLVLDGSEVLAAGEGVVIEVVENHTKYGDGEAYRDSLNYITIQHANGELTQYCHLAENSVGFADVRVGSRVQKGEVIGKVGKTGWTDRDHLHFLVFRMANQVENPHGFKSLIPQWDDQE